MGRTQAPGQAGRFRDPPAWVQIGEEGRRLPKSRQELVSNASFVAHGILPGVSPYTGQTRAAVSGKDVFRGEVFCFVELQRGLWNQVRQQKGNGQGTGGFVQALRSS